jgi:hypothetical protein
MLIHPNLVMDDLWRPDWYAYPSTAAMGVLGGRDGSSSAEAVRLVMGDETSFQREIPVAERQRLAEAGRRFLAATGGDACLVLVGPLAPPLGENGESTDSAIIRCCTARFGYPGDPPSIESIHVILDTLGGSLDIAFKTVLALSRFAKRIEVFVPRRAKSAGTLIAIGANELYLSPFGELGPLDTQVRDPRNPAIRVSALDCYQSLDHVRAFGLDTLRVTFRALADETEILIPLTELVNTSANFTIASTGPILTQVNVFEYGTWARALRIGEMYAQTLLSRVGYDRNASAEIANRLVYGYPHHPFPIDINEAKQIGLKPLSMAQESYSTAIEIVGRCDLGVTVVGFVDDITEARLLVAPAPSGRSAEQTADGTVKVRRRRQAENAKRDSETHAIASIDEGERFPKL